SLESSWFGHFRSTLGGPDSGERLSGKDRLFVYRNLPPVFLRLSQNVARSFFRSSAAAGHSPKSRIRPIPMPSSEAPAAGWRSTLASSTTPVPFSLLKPTKLE